MEFVILTTHVKAIEALKARMIVRITFVSLKWTAQQQLTFPFSEIKPFQFNSIQYNNLRKRFNKKKKKNSKAILGGWALAENIAKLSIHGCQCMPMDASTVSTGASSISTSVSTGQFQCQF